MNTPAPARTTADRIRDTLARLNSDIDAWVATVDSDGMPRLAPLSFLWDGSSLILSTSTTSSTGRNMIASDQVRLGIGDTRDVVHVEGTIIGGPAGAEVTTELADAFAAKTGFDPHGLDTYRYFIVRPDRIRGWREENELAGSVLMWAGRWL